MNRTATTDYTVVVEACFDALVADPSEQGVAAIHAAYPMAAAAVVDYLEARFVDGRPASALESHDIFWSLLAIVVASAEANAATDARAQLVERVVFRVLHADAYRRLAPLIRALILPDTMAKNLLKALKTGSEAQQSNAVELEYYLFAAGGENYTLSGAAQAEFDAASAVIRAQRVGAKSAA